VDALRASGYPVEFERVRRLIGKGSDKLIPELVGRYDETVAERKKAIFKERFLPGLRPFPGVGELLGFLMKRGVKLTVASSAGKDELDALLEAARAKRYFDSTTDADDAERSKPDPDIVQAALRKLRLPRERCVLIGDTPYDAQAAHKVGVGFIGVRCGGLWRDEDLQPALGVYDGPAELLREAGAWLRGCALRTPS
jgi:HAD superfamily hydrolase (TIGR01509 family)